MKNLLRVGALILAGSMAIFALAGGKAPVAKIDLDAAKAAANAAFDKYIKAYVTGDMELFAGVVAHDPDIVVFGTDAAERFVGYEALKGSMEKQFQSYEETRVKNRERVTHVHPSGEVCWISETWDISGTAQGQPYGIEGVRVTAVLEKRGQMWVMVQAHCSLPVSGQAVKY